MDAKTNLEARLPSRHLTEGPDRVPAAGLASGPSAACRITIDRDDPAAVLKRPRSVAELKQAGRDVAKDLADGRVNKPKFSEPASCCDAKETCFEAVTGRQYREGKVSVVRGVGPQGGPGGIVLADGFNDSKITRRAGVVAYPGGAEEVRSHADC